MINGRRIFFLLLTLLSCQSLEAWDSRLSIVENLTLIKEELTTYKDELPAKLTKVKKDVTKFVNKKNKLIHDPDPNKKPADKEGFLDTEKVTDTEWIGYANRAANFFELPNYLASPTNPFVLSELEQKKYPKYHNALCAHVFCSEDVFKAECEKLSKEDKEKITHYAKAFKEIVNGLKNEDEVDLASTSPLFLKGSLLKKTIDELVEFLEDPNFDPNAPKYFESVAPNQLSTLFDLENTTGFEQIINFASDFYSTTFQKRAVKTVDEKTKLKTLYQKNKVTLLIDAYLKDLNKDERLELAKIFKRLDFGRMLECKDATEMKVLLDEIKNDNFSLIPFAQHGIKIISSTLLEGILPESTHSGGFIDNFLDGLKDRYEDRIAAYNQAIKTPYTDRASFEAQSIVPILESSIEDVFDCATKQIYDTFLDQARLEQLFKGKQMSLPVLLELTPDEFEKVFDIVSSNAQVQADEDWLMMTIAPKVLLAMNPANQIDPKNLNNAQKAILAAHEAKIFEKLKEKCATLGFYNNLPLLLPKGFLTEFFIKDEETFLTFFSDHLKSIASPFIKGFFSTFKEYSWQQAKVALIYEDHAQLTSSLSTDNNIPTYIDLFFDLRAGKCTNSELIDYYDSIRWSSRADRSIALKETRAEALSKQEQKHKDYYAALEIPFFSKKQQPYAEYMKVLKGFISNSNITTEAEYNIFIGKAESNRFASVLYKDEASLTPEEKIYLNMELMNRVQETSSDFKLKEKEALFDAFNKEPAELTADETVLIKRHKELLEKSIKKLTPEQENAIKALDQLKKAENSATISEQQYIIFISNRELLLKQENKIDLSEIEQAKINSLIEQKKDAAGKLIPLYQDIDFLKAYNVEDQKITKRETLIRERFNIINNDLYKHNVDLLQYRLEQAEINDFFKDPLFVISSVAFKLFHDPTTFFGYEMPIDIKLLTLLAPLIPNFPGTGRDLLSDLDASMGQQLTSPALVTIRDNYLAQNKEAINFKNLLEAYNQCPTIDELPQKEQIALLQAAPLVTGKDYLTTPLQYASFIARSKTTSVRNAEALYRQFPFMEPIVYLLDSTPANLLDTYVLKDTDFSLGPIKEMTFQSLNSLSDLYFPEPPKTTPLKEYVDVALNPDQKSKVKREAKQKALLEMTKTLEQKMKCKKINDAMKKIKSEQKAKEQNNRILLEIPITDDVSFGITPHDIRSIAYEAGEAIIATKIDSLVESDKTQTLKTALLNDPKLLMLLKNIDSETRDQLALYNGREESKDVRASIIDDRPKQGFPSPLSLLPASLPFIGTASTSKQKKKEVKQNIDLKKPKYNPSTINKLRTHFEGSASQDGILTPLLNNPKSFSLWKSIGIKTIFNYIIAQCKSAALGEEAFLRTYENVEGTLKPKNDKVVLTYSNINPLTVIVAAAKPEALKQGGKFLNEASEAFKYAPRILSHLEQNSGIDLSKNPLANLSTLPQSLLNIAKGFIPSKARILHSEDFIFSEYSSATILNIFGTFFEYLLYDKLSSRKLSLYFQQNIDQLEGLIKEYQKAKKHKDSFAMKKVEKKFEKFIAKSKVSFSDRSLILKLLPRLFLLFNLVSRFGRYLVANNILGKHFVEGNAEESFFLSILSSFMGIKSKEMDTKYKVVMTGAIGAIGYSLWKSLKLIENNYYN